MTKSKKWKIPSSLRTVIFTVIVAAALIELVALVRTVNERVDELSQAQGGDGVWALSQLEVDFHRFETALAAVRSEADFPNVRNRFDLFYSRATTLRDGHLYSDIREGSRFYQDLETLLKFLNAALPYIDSDDAKLAQDLAMLREDAASISPVVRRISLAGVTNSSIHSQGIREATRQLLLQLTGVALFLIGFLLLLAYILRRLYQQSEEASHSIGLSRARIEAMIDTALDGIIVAAPNGKILEMNASAEEIFGRKIIESETLYLSDLLRGLVDNRRFKSPAESGLVDIGRAQTTAFHADGKTFPAEVSLSQSRTSEQDDVYVAYVRDISERLKAQAQLTEARDKALDGEKAKAKLLAVMNHEIRTPLNGILGALDLLKKTDPSKHQRKYLEAMETSGDVLMHHVDDVLELSRLDADAVARPHEVLNLHQLADDLIHSQQAAAEASGNELTLKLSHDLPMTVLGDAQGLRHVLLNLLGNALKFNDNGLVSVDIEPHGTADLIEFRVIDDGPGIEDAYLDRLFEDFYTTDPTFSRNKQGTGLGLGITKRLVKAMGGKIGVESIEGDGSMFWFRVPLPEANATYQNGDSQPTPLGTGKSARILLVEDNEINQMITGDMLRNAGHGVDIAPSGSAAMRMTKTNVYDLILMDISMPGMDGISTAKQIRNTSPLAKNTPIYALTAQAIEPTDTSLVAAGITNVLPKPLTSDALQSAVSSGLSRNACANHNHALGEGGLLNDEVFGDIVSNLGAKRVAQHFQEFGKDLDDLLAPADNKREANSERHQTAHTLAGAAAVLGLCDLHSALASVEHSHCEKDAISEAKVVWDKSRTVYQAELDRISN